MGVQAQDKQEDATAGATQSYLKFRIRKMHASLGLFGIAQDVRQAFLEQEPASESLSDIATIMNGLPSALMYQRLLDAAVDSVVRCTDTLTRPNCPLQEIFAALQSGVVCLMLSLLWEEARTLGEGAIGLARTAKEQSDSPIASIVLCRLIAAHSLVLYSLGSPDRDLLQEGVELSRQLVSIDPQAFEADLARALSALGNLPDVASAHAANKEAVELYRRLASADVSEYSDNLALALRQLSYSAILVGALQEGLDAAQEACTLQRREVERHRSSPDSLSFRSQYHLADALTSVAYLQYQLDEDDSWLASAQEAVLMFRALHEHVPVYVAGGLARALDGLASKLSMRGSADSALPYALEAVKICRQLFKERTEVWQLDLATALTTLAHVYTMVAPDASIEPAQQAVDLLRPLVEEQPEYHHWHLLSALQTLSKAQSLSSRSTGKATATAEEALSLARAMATQQPARGYDVANTLALVYFLHLSAGTHSTARDCLDELSDLCQGNKLWCERMAKDTRRDLPYFRQLRQEDEAIRFAALVETLS
jgi:hypothetical protein